MAFDRTKFTRWSSGDNTLVKNWAYSTADNLAAVVASAYFNQMGAPGENVLLVGDLIYVDAADQNEVVEVIAITPNVLVTQMTGTVDDNAITTTKINDNAVTIAKLENALQKGVGYLEVSFETGEQATQALYFPFKVTINKIRAYVTKAIAGTDDATITAKNNAGSSMGSGLITLPASSVLATEANASPNTNNIINVDEKLQLTCAKTTAGGRARITVEFTRTA